MKAVKELKLGQDRMVWHYVNGCDICNRAKTLPSKPVGKLCPNSIPDRNWQKISVNLISPLPESQGYYAILVVVSRRSKQSHMIKTSSTMDSLGLAKLYRDHIWKLHGLPEEIISD